jgi:hypothetical protein
MSPPAFTQFRSLVGCERHFRARLWQRLGDHSNVFSIWTPSEKNALKVHNRDVLLIEDVDIRCLLAIDAEFNLDPKFILSYTKGTARGFQSPAPRDECHQTETGSAGSWYTTADHITNDTEMTPGRWLHLYKSPWQRNPENQGRDKEPSAKLALWQESCKQIRPISLLGSQIEFFTSVSACYCLSDSLRKLRPEDVLTSSSTRVGF